MMHDVLDDNQDDVCENEHSREVNAHEVGEPGNSTNLVKNTMINKSLQGKNTFIDKKKISPAQLELERYTDKGLEVYVLSAERLRFICMVNVQVNRYSGHQ